MKCKNKDHTDYLKICQVPRGRCSNTKVNYLCLDIFLGAANVNA